MFVAFVVLRVAGINVPRWSSKSTRVRSLGFLHELAPTFGQLSVWALKNIPSNLAINVHPGRKLPHLHVSVSVTIVFLVNLITMCQGLDHNTRTNELRDMRYRMEALC